MIYPGGGFDGSLTSRYAPSNPLGHIAEEFELPRAGHVRLLSKFLRQCTPESGGGNPLWYSGYNVDAKGFAQFYLARRRCRQLFREFSNRFGPRSKRHRTTLRSLSHS